MPEIHKKLSLILQDISPVGGNKTNTFHKYKFRGIDDVMNAVHGVFAKHGVFCVPEVLERDMSVRKTPKGDELQVALVRVKYTFFAADGSSVEAIEDGEGSDKGDKALNKARTAAYKTVLTQMFCIPTEDCNIDVESDASVDEDFEVSKPRNIRKPSPEKKVVDYSVIPKTGSGKFEIRNIRTGERELFKSGTPWKEIGRDFLKSALKKSTIPGYQEAINQAIKFRKENSMMEDVEEKKLNELDMKYMRAKKNANRSMWANAIVSHLLEHGIPNDKSGYYLDKVESFRDLIDNQTDIDRVVMKCDDIIEEALL